MLSKKRKVSIIAAVFFALFALIYLVPGIRGLTLSKSSRLDETSKKGELVEFTAVGAKDVYDVRHTFLKIPIGTEHYYYLVSADIKGAPMLIKASEKWYNENFDERGIAKKGSVTVKGEVRELKVRYRDRIIQFNNTIESTASEVSTSLYVNAQYKTGSILYIVSGLSALVFGAMLVLMLWIDGLVQLINTKVGTTVFVITVIGLLWLYSTSKLVN